MNRYQSNETIVRERIQSSSECSSENTNTPFIELTVCPTYGAAYNDDALTHYGMEKGKYRSKGSFAPINYNETTDLRKVFNSVTYDIDEILFGIYINTLSRNNSKISIDFDGSNQSDYIVVTTKYKPNLGRCYAIHPSDHVVQLEVVGIDIVAKMNIYVYFGHPGQFMHQTKTKVIRQ